MTELFFAPAQPARGLILLTGEDRASFLQGLISNDVRQVGPTRAIWAALLTAQGKYLHDFFVASLGEGWLIEGEGERVADLKRRLGIYKLRAKVVIEDVSDRFEVLQAWGADAGHAFGLAEPGQAVEQDGATAFLDPRLTTLGLRLIAPKGTGAGRLATLGLAPGDIAAWDRLRLSLGIPDGSRDMVLEKAILLENGFDELHGVAWDKGCYVGQELTARTKYRGLVKKRLMPVAVEGPLPEPGTLILKDGQEAGEIRSGRDGLAVALVRLEALEAGGPLTAGDATVRPQRPDWAKF
ncbi:CAF17-like 4Fe-4S cluster assembly/insertion protein YgfZ [Aliidongia dinghuensis]|uniref:CAF17-like 4Fe-4S cluster assembly/insertion protein YgfZ n=1 Tax=Aliidongia dinghuensis TaxID=1867774 RepID=UPI0016634A86|nr:folate-binding protein YgfZ [Aliidongia dinghuensis]